MIEYDSLLNHVQATQVMWSTLSWARICPLWDSFNSGTNLLIITDSRSEVYYSEYMRILHMKDSDTRY